MRILIYGAGVIGEKSMKNEEYKKLSICEFTKAAGSYLILEVKGDNMIDDPVVKAKGAAAEEVAVESSMKYEMLKGTDIMEGKAKF